MSPDAPLFDGTGKTVLVAGGTSGITRGIARAFAVSGAKVYVLSRSSDKVANTVSELTALGTGAAGIAADVR